MAGWMHTQRVVQCSTGAMPMRKVEEKQGKINDSTDALPRRIFASTTSPTSPRRHPPAAELLLAAVHPPASSWAARESQPSYVVRPSPSLRASTICWAARRFAGKYKLDHHPGSALAKRLAVAGHTVRQLHAAGGASSFYHAATSRMGVLQVHK